MSQHSTLRSLCVSRIAPVIAALTFSFGVQQASATQAAFDALTAKLSNPNIIPGGNADLLKAKSTDLINAVALVLQDPAYAGLTPEDVVTEALLARAGKVRTDKDTIADDLVATAIASRQLSDETAAANVIIAALNVNFDPLNPTATKLVLKPTGKAGVLAAGLKAVSQDDTTIGAAIGNQLAALTIPERGDMLTLLVNTSKSLGKSAGVASNAFSALVTSLLDSPDDDLSRVTLDQAALKVAASTPAAAGALYGGLAHSQNDTNTGPAFDDPGLVALSQTLIGNAKLAKAHGEILANVLTDFDGNLGTLTSDLIGRAPKSTGLIAQGLIRSNGATADVNAVLGAAIPTVAAKSLVSFAGVVAQGNGDSITDITTSFAAKAVTGADKINLNTAIVNGVAVTDPSAAYDATRTMLLSAGVAVDPLPLATASVAKIKVTAAAGAMAAAAIELEAINESNTAAQVATNTVGIMVKGSKAATDIAREVAGLSQVSADPVLFAQNLSDGNKKFVINAAVGVSLAWQQQSPAITYGAITHPKINGVNAVDKSAIAQVAKIAGAVATAVEPEQTSLIGAKLAENMSEKGLGANKPLNISSLSTLATSLAKALQSKPNVSTKNRIDELGELGAMLAWHVIGKFTSAATAAKNFAAENKAITAIGSAIFKTLSKKPLANGLTLAADQRAFFDIVGSIARSIKESSLSDADKALYLSVDSNSPGILLKSFGKLAGKVGTTPYTAVLTAIGQGGSDTQATREKFESGKDLTLPGIVNDPETDYRDSSI